MRIIKTIIFHLLLSTRGIIRLLSKLFAIMFIFMFISLFLISDFAGAPFAAKTISLVFSILFTTIYWFYDYLIFYFQPENIEISLIN